MGSVDRMLRRLVPAVPALSRVKVVQWPLDVIDRALCWPWRELRGLPPNHLRIRVGVGNRLLFNAAHFRMFPINFWFEALASGLVKLDSTIVDIGCGCGRFAMPLRDLHYHGRGFAGKYVGVDVDEEMLAWCRENFPRERFEFVRVDAASATYNPGGRQRGGAARLPLADGSADLVLTNSLFTHLLEEDFAGYVRESARVLRAGGVLQMSAFVVEDVREDRAAAARWTFGHRVGAAHVESLRYPEAATAYERGWIEALCRGAGFEAMPRMPVHTQTVLRWRRVEGGAGAGA